MKLTTRILLVLTAWLLPLMVLWATFFCYTLTREINAEVDEALEEYASLIKDRCCEGRQLPALNSGSNNSYTLQPVEEHVARRYLEPMFRDEEVYIPEKGEDEPARVMTVAFQDGEGRYLLLELATPTFEKDDLIETVLWSLVSLFAILIIVVIVVATLSMRRTLQPLYALLKWLDGYIPGSRHVCVPNDTDITELRKLNEAAQSAVDRSEAMFDAQKQFIGNASHELQTPLAVISNRVEHLINYTNPTEQQLEELVKIDHSLRHSIRLNRTLLQLARIDSGEVAASEDVDLVPILEEVVESCNEIYAAKGMKCVVTADEHLYIYVSESLARILILNLVKNAFVHGMEGSVIEVRLGDGMLKVSNVGDKPLDGARLFDRFYTFASHEAGTGTGLGLAIVKSICDHYGYNVRYGYAVQHHTFTVEFN
ncbi:MAG: HAMP domain-containing histidine kinase [Alistipes sp.]|nr:HAMP domain-containing histidine kinase [Alistipes sp.]